MGLLNYVALALAAVAGVGGAATSKSTADASMAVCHALAARYPGQVAASWLTLNLTQAYDYEQATQRFWSAACGNLVPACVFLPTQAADVAGAVQELNKQPGAVWAVKGGGHNSNTGYSSTAGGVLIAMETMSDTTLDAQGLAHVGPGARWGDVMTALEPDGVAVVGGRLGDVGVGGYSLGGGLSFLSTEYGLAADSVVEYQVVTADGQMRTVSATENQDLYRALKGGGNQFAIVTEFVMHAYPIGTVWGGVRTYDVGQKDALLAAVQNLTGDYHDPKAAVIVTLEDTVQTLAKFALVFYFYNGPQPGAILDEFLAIPYLTSDCEARSYANLLNANSVYSVYGMRYQIRAATIPNLPGAAGADVYSHTWDAFLAQSAAGQLETLLDNLIFTIAFQPLPHQLAAATNAAPGAGNVLGLSPDAGDRVWLELDASWLLPTTDTQARALVDGLTPPMLQYVQQKYAGVAPTNYQAGDLADAHFNPVFMNDAMYDQDVLHSYGADNYNMLAATQKKWDPNGFFSQRTGGFKFT